MRIDQFGRPLKNMAMEEIVLLNRVPYMTDEQQDATYICYDDHAKTEIRRITKQGTVTKIEFAYGSWDSRASLEYVPINSYVEIDR